eukprot:SAG11_NODE_1056_length_6009_cov_30.238877_2_plen_161_part_00
MPATTAAADEGDRDEADHEQQQQHPESRPAERWVCGEDGEGLRLERALRDRFRTGGDASRPLSNRLLRDAIKRGEVSIDGEVVRDKTRILHAGQSVELRYDLDKAAAAKAAAAPRVEFLHVDPHFAVVWKVCETVRAQMHASQHTSHPASRPSQPQLIAH